jgi:hypothetical protein
LEGHSKAFSALVGDQKVISIRPAIDLSTESPSQFPYERSNPACVFRFRLFASCRWTITMPSCIDPDWLERDLPVNSGGFLHSSSSSGNRPYSEAKPIAIHCISTEGKLTSDFPAADTQEG